jgi:hypothetical protein
MNMFAESDAKTIKDYIESVPDDRKEDILALDTLIKSQVPSLKPYFASNMLGYGKFKYLDSKKVVQNWPVVALANQKNYISLYVCAVDGGEYLAEKYESELGKVSIGRSCIRFKKLEDVNLPGLKKVLKLATKSPGLVGTKRVD